MPKPRSDRNPHDWNSYENYLAVHDRCMERFEHSFVERDSLSFRPLSPHRILISGSIHCHGGLVLHVEKTLEVNARRQVRGLKYRYRAQFAEPPTREIFRYDNAHGYAGHPDDSHKHTFSPISWKPVHPPEHIGRARWATLQDVLSELYQWWIDHRDDPRIYP